MDCLPIEVVSHILQFLSVSDRKEAALVSRKWYNASLHPQLQKDVIVKCQPPNQNCLPPTGLVQRKLTHLALGDWETNAMTEEQLVDLLSQCPNLVELDISRCNALFLSGKLLESEKDRNYLREVLSNVRELKLGCLRHMTDVTFLRLVYTMENLEKISLTSANMIFGSGMYDVNGSSSAMLNFSTFLKYVKEKASQLKKIDLSRTSVHDKALAALARTDGLLLDELVLQSCVELSDKGIKTLVTHQRSLQLLDLSGCKELGASKAFFANFTNLPKLHSLILRKCPKVGQCDIHSLVDISSLRNVDMGEALNLFDKDLIKGLCGPSQKLRSVSLPFCPDLNDMFVVSLCESNPNLTHLDLSSCLKLTDSSLHAITRNLTSLRSLRLAYCRGISDLGMLGYVPEHGLALHHVFDHDHEGCPCTRERESKIFRKPTGIIEQHNHCISKAHTKVENGEELHMLSNLTSLQILDLSYCPRITDFSIARAVNFRELRSLSLNSLPKMSDAAMKTVAQQNPSLETVSVRSNASITDVSVLELVSKCPRLASLDVSQCDGLTDKCLDSLITKAKRLRHLDISFCGNISQEKVAVLEQRLPNVKVIFRPYVY
ncbi:dynein regulatory complex subunit 6 isoform X1 [Aplysia californica]|uniref:Dynein regulatory complex subunit 6 isoform X1 n=1 Tax=Aplysia californica TaxID=6500 RepID=A0ABM0JDR1_APLCA|nr:dynein regulatory complex subunit 6 isoform X1 [Aplysia californica]